MLCLRQMFRDDNGAVGCALMRGMTVARSLANSDAPTSEACNAVLGCALPFIGILGLVRLGRSRVP